MTKRIPYSVSSFEAMITNGYYYVDKTMMIKDLLDASLDGVTLITRPRRFGKSLNMSMLECFLDIERKGEGMRLFDGLAISGETEFCKEYMHKYPVIHVSFKDAVGKKKEEEKPIKTAMRGLKGTIGMLAERYRFLLSSKELDEADRIAFRQISTRNPDTEGEKFLMSDDNLETALATLSTLLKKHYGKPAVILIDEYDVPLNTAFELEYYEYFIGTYRSILSTALKENDSLAFAVVTGCLRISKESIFTGVNNFRSLDVTKAGLREYFGFDDNDVSAMLEYYGLSECHGRVKSFYDGYRFGKMLVYNPFSINQFVADAIDSAKRGEPIEYHCEWLNTSGNDIMKRLLAPAVKKKGFANAVESLENRGEIKTRIVEQLTFDSMYKTPEGLWTVMLHSGYLTLAENLGEGYAMLRVPNEEVLKAFDDLVLQISQERIAKGDTLKNACEAVESFDPARIEEALNTLLKRIVSIRDTATREKRENYYHGIMNAMLAYRGDWEMESSAETGDGYCDIMVENDEGNWGIVFELKYSDNATDFKKALDEGEDQIFKLKYPEELHENERDPIHLYSIAFRGKRCKVREVFEEDHPAID